MGLKSRIARHPHPLWRLRGYANLNIGGQRLKFCEATDPLVLWWAWRAWAGVWEPRGIEFFRSHVQDGDVVFDVGARFGGYSLLASRLVGPSGRVYAFEPDPVARRLLAGNVAANGASNVTVVPAAVRARPGSAWLRGGRLGSGETFVSEDAGDLEVEAVSLVSFCRERSLSPAVLKVDVEGGEASVLNEESATLVQKARAVLVEIHHEALRKDGIDPEAFRSQLLDYGKRVIELDRRSEGNYILALA
jgi:FkbM family methyltransferase